MMQFTRFFFFLLLCLSLISTEETCAQQQNKHWYFGNEAAIRFDAGGPVSLTNSNMFSIEGCASVSDPANGKLLFYSNSQKIWNANHQVMPNGDSLLGGPNTSSTQGALIVPYPSRKGQYVLFTVDETTNNAPNGFRYSVVDMALNNGLGDVISNQKNILIQTNTTERLAVAKKADGKAFWILIHERDNAVFKAFELNARGISQNPVVSNVGLVHGTQSQSNGDETMGCMKFNADYSRVAVALFATNKIQLFSFDNCSGQLSNPITINTPDNPYGLEFSPDKSKLYYTCFNNLSNMGEVYQVDLQSGSVSGPGVKIGVSSSMNFQNVGSLQLAPDGKIYVAINSESWLSAIAQPNAAGPACSFVDKAVVLLRRGLSPSPGLLGLPQSVLVLDSLAQFAPEIEISKACLGSVFSMRLKNLPPNSRVFWNFGDSSSIANTDSVVNTAHLYSDTGLYQVRAVLVGNCYLDTLTQTVRVTLCDTPETECSVEVPNVFTPNGDGLNDVFSVLTKCKFKGYRLQVYNRWGNRVFYSEKGDEKWNGKQESSDCGEGVYTYLLDYQFPGGEIKTKSGMLVLLR